jgi:hypothetical protein
VALGTLGDEFFLFFPKIIDWEALYSQKRLGGFIGNS